MRRTYTVDTGYTNGGVSAPDAGGVVRSQARGQGRSAIALTVRLDVEALDEQIQRESDAAERDHEGW